MSRQSLGLSPPLQNYLLSVSLRETDTLRELREFTAQHPGAVMQIAPEQGQFMGFLVKLTGAMRVLEIGTYTGYSSLVMAQSMPEEGRILTLDVNPETGRIARDYWDKASVGHKIEQQLGPARDTLRNLEGPFDLVFIDADKCNYGFYYEHALRLLRSGGLILLDNVLWDGRVVDPHANDPDTSALRALNQKLHGDERVDLSMIPLADGLSLVRKR